MHTTEYYHHSPLYSNSSNIDESFVVVEERADMLVFGEANPYSEDAVSPNALLPR